MNDGWSSRVLSNLKAFSRILFGGRDLPNFTPLEGYNIYIIYLQYVYYGYIWFCFRVLFFLPIVGDYNVYMLFTFYKTLRKRWDRWILQGVEIPCRRWTQWWRSRRALVAARGGGEDLGGMCCCWCWIQGPGPGSSYTHPWRVRAGT